MQYQASQPGIFPPSIDGLSLPEGSGLKFPDGTETGLWLSTSGMRVAEADVLQEGSIRQFAATGLWPVMVDPEDTRDFDEISLEGASIAIPESFDVSAYFHRRAQDELSSADLDRKLAKVLKDFDPDRPGSFEPTSPDEVTYIIGQDFVHFGLAKCTRPADIPATIGWAGAANYDLDGGQMSMILRSWEDRFGVFLSGLGRETMSLSVQHLSPPSQLQLAAELYLVCPDVVEQGVGSFGALQKFLSSMHGALLWWD